MGVSAQLHASTSLPKVGHSAGLVAAEKRNPRSASSNSHPILYSLYWLSCSGMCYFFTIHTHGVRCRTLQVRCSWMVIEDESSNVNSVHDLHSVHTINNEQDSSLTITATDLMRLGTSVVCNYWINWRRKLIVNKSLCWHRGSWNTKAMRKSMCSSEYNFST